MPPFLSFSKKKNKYLPYERSLLFFYTTRSGKFFKSFLTHRWFSNLLGHYYNLALSKRAIKPFVKKYNICLAEAEQKLHEFASFNDFFTRKLKPEARLIDPDPASVVSPSDGTVLVIPFLKHSSEFPIKNQPFHLTTLLNDAALAQSYVGGSALIFRLAPHDYHRYHFPLDGIPAASYRIKGRYDSVNPIAFTTHQPLHTNERRLIQFTTQTCGTVIIIPVGALGVGKIIDTYTPYTFYPKGSEAGYFCFGGSTLVVLFSAGTLTIDPLLIKNSAEGKETPIKMGNAIGTIRLSTNISTRSQSQSP